MELNLFPAKLPVKLEIFTQWSATMSNGANPSSKTSSILRQIPFYEISE